MMDWFTPRRFAGLLALLIVATYPEVVTLRATFFHRDFSLFGFPLAHHFHSSFWRGEWPLWNPYNDCGLPFLAQWNTMTLYPGSLLFLLIPPQVSLGLFCLAHLFLAGMGMYWLARRWTNSALGAAVAGAAFALSSFSLHSLMWPSTVAAWGWMPWVVLAVERACLHGGRATAVAILVGAMQMLTGTPEVILITWLFLAPWAAGLAFSKVAIRRLLPVRFGIIVFGVTVLCAAQLLPFQEMLGLSQRHAGYGIERWAMPWHGWANFFLPPFGCLLSSHGQYLQPTQLWVFSYYSGVTVAALALMAVFVARGRRVLLLTLGSVAAVAMAMGNEGPLYPWLIKLVPQIGFMRFPVKWVLLAVFALPLLAAFVVARCETASMTEWPILRRRLIWMSAGTALAVVLLVLGTNIFQPMHMPFDIVVRNGAVRIVFLALTTAALLALRSVTAARWRGGLQIALVTLLWLDVFTSDKRPNPTVARDMFDTGWARQQAFPEGGPRLGQARIAQTGAARTALAKVDFADGVERVTYSRLGFLSNCNLLDEVPLLQSFYPLYIRSMAVVERLLFEPDQMPEPFLDFLGAAYVTAPGKNLEWIPRTNALPWITAGQKPIFDDKTNTVAALGRSDFKPREVVYLPPEIQSQIIATNRVDVKLNVTHFGTHRINLQTDSPQPALVVISQMPHPAWRVYVDGSETTLLRANYAFQALEVPSGSHQVELRYVDRKFHAGLVASWLGLILCAGLIASKRTFVSG